jgi:hypothetical protein
MRMIRPQPRISQQFRKPQLCQIHRRQQTRQKPIPTYILNPMNQAPPPLSHLLKNSLTICGPEQPVQIKTVKNLI